MLLVGVHDPDGTGDLGHEADTTEGALELVALTAQAEQLTLGHAAGGDVVEVDLLELLEPLQPLVDGLEVGEHAAEPALVHVRHADALRLLSDGFLCLLLRADEQDAAAVGDGLLDELVGVVQVTESLVQIDDVDAVAVGEDEPLHLRVPPAGLVSEVDARLQHLAHGDDCHDVPSAPRGAFQLVVPARMADTLTPTRARAHGDRKARGRLTAGERCANFAA